MPPPIVVKSYRGHTQPGAAAVFMKDASTASIDGYKPVSQSWAEGRRTDAASICVGLGVVCLIGGVFLWIGLLAIGILLIIIGLVSGKGDGALTVTYQRPDYVALPVPEPSGPHPSAILTQIADLRDRGLISPEDFEAKKTDLLARM